MQPCRKLRASTFLITPLLKLTSRSPQSAKHQGPQEGAALKPQLKNWVEKREKHEQVAVGEKVSRSEAEMKKYLEDLERKIEGRGA